MQAVKMEKYAKNIKVLCTSSFDHSSYGFLPTDQISYNKTPKLHTSLALEYLRKDNAWKVDEIDGKEIIAKRCGWKYEIRKACETDKIIEKRKIWLLWGSRDAKDHGKRLIRFEVWRNK